MLKQGIQKFVNMIKKEDTYFVTETKGQTYIYSRYYGIGITDAQYCAYFPDFHEMRTETTIMVDHGKVTPWKNSANIETLITIHEDTKRAEATPVLIEKYVGPKGPTKCRVITDKEHITLVQDKYLDRLTGLSKYSAIYTIKDKPFLLVLSDVHEGIIFPVNYQQGYDEVMDAIVSVYTNSAKKEGENNV